MSPGTDESGHPWARAPARACRLRHRPQTPPVTYAIDPDRRCRWRRRQVRIPVGGV